MGESIPATTDIVPQTFVAPASLDPTILERGTYTASTEEEVELRRVAREAEAKRKAEEARKNQLTSATPKYSGGGSKDDWLRASGIAESEWGYVDYIVQKESSWNPNAVNKSSGASGLVQALPCGKVPGNCFNPVDNLRWANGYAKGRYGSWEQAYSFWTKNHWW